MKSKIELLARKCVQNLNSYSSARDEFKQGGRFIFLDANERFCDPNGEDRLNRYPDPKQTPLRAALSEYNKVPIDNIFVGNGSDEAIELLIEIFCEPGIDEIIITPPTYGMYKVCADAHGAITRVAPLTPEFQIDSKALKDAINHNTKLIFICSPNNPTGNAINHDSVLSIMEMESFNGLIVIDEAYVEFCPDKSFLKYLSSFDRLIILRTFSKAWGLAGARVGMAFSSEEVINLMMRKKPPYNVSTLSQEAALKTVKDSKLMTELRSEIVGQRNKLLEKLSTLSGVQTFNSDSNFILVRINDATKIYQQLIDRGIIVRNRSQELHCQNTLRITVGNADQNEAIFRAIKEINNV